MDNKDDTSDFENMFLRLVHVIIIWVMLQMAQTLLGLITVAQFVIMLVNQRQPNDGLAEFGTTLGVWMAKAARFQTGASEVKPWPWTELD
jgi:hypothetical protein